MNEDAKEYMRRWAVTRRILGFLLIRVAMVPVVLVGVLVWLANPHNRLVAMVGWLLGVSIVATAALTALYFDAKAQEYAPVRWSMIWRESAREPWFSTPDRKEP